MSELKKLYTHQLPGGGKNVEWYDEVKRQVIMDEIRGNPNIANSNELGYFGNIWVRSFFLEKAGMTNGMGHKHNHDHVTLLISGKVLVEVDGFEPTEFVGPTFIIVDKDHHHKFTALSDNVLYFCVFALRDLDGEVTDIYSGNNSPYRKQIKVVE